MKNYFDQDNPYLVKNKRFKRTSNDTETLADVSQEELKTLYSVKSSEQMRRSNYDNFQSRPNRDMKVVSKGKDREGQRGVNFLQKRQLLWRMQQQNQQQARIKDQKISVIILQRERRIVELEKQLLEKQQQNQFMRDKLAKFETMHKSSVALQKQLNDQLSKIQNKHSQQTYALKQAVRSLQIQVGCLNRKWSTDFERMLKEKELECRSLREKYTCLIRSKREISRKNSILTQNPSTTTSGSRKFICESQNQLLDLSSFELSRQSIDH